MSDTENFQKEHGAEWASITQHPAFGAAMSLLNLRKISAIASLTDDQIEKDGKLLLADLRGHLNHENDLINLSTVQEFVFGTPVPETYPSPEEEAAEHSSDKPQPEPPRKPRKRK